MYDSTLRTRNLSGQYTTLYVWSPMPQQTIQTVEGGDLIAFRQRRVIEDRVDKIIDLSMKGHDGLADVDQFCGSFADSMNTEQMPGVPVKQQFEYTGFVTDQLSTGDFLITC